MPIRYSGWIAVGLSGRPSARRGRRDGRCRLAVVGQLRPKDRPALSLRAAAFVAISKSIEDELREAWNPGRRASRLVETIHRTPKIPRIVAIPNGVPVPEVAWQRRPELAAARLRGFVGRLAPEKGLDTLIDAWPSVRAGPAGPS